MEPPRAARRGPDAARGRAGARGGGGGGGGQPPRAALPGRGAWRPGPRGERFGGTGRLPGRGRRGGGGPGPGPGWDEGRRRRAEPQDGPGGRRAPPQPPAPAPARPELRFLLRHEPREQPQPQAQAGLRRIGYKFLESLLHRDASEVVITLVSSSGLRELLAQVAMKPSFLELLCQVLRKACSSRMDRQSVQQLLGLVKESNFLKVCLPQYAADMMTEPAPALRQQYAGHVGNIIALLQDLVSIFPASSVQNISVLMSILPASINVLRASGVDIAEQTERSLEKVQALIQHLQEKKREGTLRTDSYTLLQPQPGGQEDSYRAMTVYPTYNEVHRDEKPFLRPNIVSGRYESTGVYLDTHFRLLREDFVRPLREGILELLQSFEDKGLRKRRFDDIRIYFDMRIITPLCSSSGIVYKVQFDTKPLKFVRWQNSKRLLYGSLVCMSKDHFETFLFATVSNRDSTDLAKGIVQLCFTGHSQALLAEAQPSDSFLMVETTAYFEAYRHVLEGLQEVQEEDVPFQKYIVECDTLVGEPAYLRMGSTYNLAPLMEEPSPDGERGLASPEGLRRQRVNVLDPSQWPSMEALKLDESQMQALQLALTKELAIIQGPPGTGKTYVGLKIVQAFLTNEQVWQKSPILVVCYTNHALDQFLEGIYKSQKNGIVRVGGRSSSEVLKQFTLRELRKKCDFRRNLPPHLRRAYVDITNQMKHSEQELREGARHLECTTYGVLHERHLERYISPQHWDSLTNGPEDEWFYCFGSRHSMILEWLGLGVNTFTQNTAENPGPETTGGQQEGEEEEEGEVQEELLEIEEEADLIQADRVIEEEEAARPQRRKEEENGAVMELANRLLAMKLEKQGLGAAQPQQEGEWEMQPAQRKKMKHKMKVELHKLSTMTEKQAEAIQDLWQLDLGSRWQLYRLWLQMYQGDIRRQILQHERQYQVAAERLAELRLQEDLCILKEAQVVGMTTTGAAKYRQILQKVEPRIVIVEEAAEVLEAHTITTLSKACQHLVLIGDHQQLRPSANVYDLAKNFNLEMSLFERLVKVGLPFVRLNYQHRMRPEIAQLLTPHIYQELENHPSVLTYENIKNQSATDPEMRLMWTASTTQTRHWKVHVCIPPKLLGVSGVASNLFFVEHDFPEEEIQEGKSHQNPHEAKFVVELCKYFLCQDYLPSQITILTTYTGQLFCLRRLMPAKTFAGVKVHVVDKYQGEENDIILLSLVRSNREERAGFLQISNRICVALSRAKKGLYCIGNMGMLGKVPLWSKIIHTLREKGRIGRSLILCCQNHPDTRTLVSKAADFCQVPEGGCSRPCEFRLSCGHVCTRACHPYDIQHKEFQCLKPCQKVLCKDGHRCPHLCSEPCEECMVKVPKTIPKCGHPQMVPCSTPASEFSCQEPCQKYLTCGHKCNKLCGQECTAQCPELVMVTLKCGHDQQVKCWITEEMENGMPVKCKTKCVTTLDCGHVCPGSCNTCYEGRFHEQCKNPCKRFLVCSHKCQQPCTGECPPCQQACQNHCVHSQCKKKCGEMCIPCMEPCEWRCQHYQCTQLCSEPCNRPRCDVRCSKKLRCGHPCIGLCGEPCPKKCLVCDHDEVTQIFFGFEEDPEACFVQLEDCGHIFESQGLDYYMDEDESAVKLKVCPICQTPIRKNLRYGTIVKKRLEEIEKVKEKIQGPAREIETSRHRLQATLEGKAVLRRVLPTKYDRLEDRLKQPNLSTKSVGLLENLINFYERVADLTGSLSKLDPSEREVLRKRLAEVQEWLSKQRLSFSSQELSDLQSEMQRVTYLANLLTRCSAAGTRLSAALAQDVAALRTLLQRTGRFTAEDEAAVRVKMEELKAALPTSGLGISEEERVQIVSAIGCPRGHWFKCRNGHVYVIGECGGAMEQGVCPECQAVIGGHNHALDDSNRLAPEMDGAAHAAWSDTANNLLNFEELGRLL